MRRGLKALILTGTIALVLTPIQARADGFVSPWVGSAFGSSIDNGRTTFGVNAGAMGAGIIGGEIDFGYNPSFFGTQNDFGHNTVLDLTLNFTFGMPMGNGRGARVRPFFRAGAGLIRTQIDGGSVFNVSSSENHLGYDLGGGVMGFFSDRVGVRGDVTYFRNMTGNIVNGVDQGSLHYVRWSAGVVFL